MDSLASLLGSFGLLSPQCATGAALFTPSCISFLVSKVLGYAIIAGSLTIKVPQIMKIANAKSADGIANSMFMLELLGYVISMLYSFVRGFPFSTYGETVFMAVQNILVIYLVAKYNRDSLAVVFGYFALLAAVAYVMLSGIIPFALLSWLYSSNIIVFAASRLPQILESFKTKSSGKLAFMTFFLGFAGSLARVFTTIQEVNDPATLLSYGVAVLLNGIILAQIVIYGDREAIKGEIAAEIKKQVKENVAKLHKE